MILDIQPIELAENEIYMSLVKQQAKYEQFCDLARGVTVCAK